VKGVAAVAVAAFVAACLGAASAVAASPRAITVHGTGIVNTVPTSAVFTFGVSANAPTAAAALAGNAAQMNKLIAALKGKGIAPADIQTAEVSLSANRNQSGSRIFNYTASNSVTALVRAIANAGPVIDAAVAAGANQLSGPTLSSTDQQALSRRALAAALADARARANVIAKAAGVRLGKVLSVSEESATPFPVEGRAAASPAAATPIEAGTIQIEADLTVTFAIG
jgi:uncharacterized protein YggE